MEANLGKFFLLLICIYCFFSYISPYMLIVLGVGILGIVLCQVSKKRISISKEIVLPCSAAIISLIESNFSQYDNDMLELAITIVAFLIVLEYIKKSGEKTKIFIMNSLWILSGIHVFATLAEYISPNVIMKLNSDLLNPDAYSAVYYLLNQNKLAGISPQTGTDAFYICIFIFITLDKLVNKKSLALVVMGVLGVFALCCTKKRGALLIFIVIFLLIIFLYFYRKINNINKKLLKIFMVFGLAVLGVIFLMTFGYIFVYEEVDEISSGRLSLFSFMCENIKLFGNGFGFVKEKLSVQGHNIYLQLFCEIGIFSLVFLGWFCEWFKKVFKLVREHGFKRFITASLCVQLFFLLYGMVGNPLFDYFELGTYMLLFSIGNYNICYEEC